MGKGFVAGQHFKTIFMEYNPLAGLHPEEWHRFQRQLIRSRF